MRDLIQDALRGHGADYVEIRVEESESTRISYRGRELDEISRGRNLGGNVRALANGGWGFVSFNDLSGLRDRVAQAVGQARLAGQEATRLAETPIHDEVVELELGLDPRSVPVSAKKELLDAYNQLVWSVPSIQTTNLGYGDGYKRSVFASSEGHYIEQSRIDVTMYLSATARRDGDVQQATFSKGWRNDFAPVQSLHEEVKQTAEKAVALLDAPTVKGGEYTVVLDPILAGVFCHEAFGHLSEADHVYENPQLLDLMRLGRRFSGTHLNIVDGAAVSGLRGSFKYDEEGTLSQRSDLIREGILVGRLHSRETASKMGERATGNARAIDYRWPPIVRMTNTFIEPGSTSFEDMIADVREGVYAKNWYGGTTSMEQFTFSAGEAYMIRNGKIAELVRPVMLTGNLFTTLENLDAVGNDLGFNQGGGCGKGGQVPLPVSTGAPHIRIQNCLIGGKG